MTSFLQTFSGSAISPSEVAYASYSFGSDLTLYWPQFSAGQTDIAARFMNMMATANTSLNVIMPDATLVSVGYDVIIFNAGSYAFDVVDANGGAIATIATGQTYYILLNDNTTAAGGWQTVQFGVGTGSASAAALAGAGLLAAAGLLEQNILATTVSGSTALTSTARAILQVWNGGAGTVTLPSAASVGNGFFFPFANDGSGSVTVATVGGEQIDGASTSIFTQTQSAFIVSTGTAWFTVGKGLQNNFSVTVLNLNVAGSSDVTETSAQAQSIIQQYTGVLTGSINVIVPTTPQLYFVYNNTTGPYTLTVKTASGTGVEVTQGTNTILYCDGTNVVGAFTSSIGTSITLPVGSAGAPTLNFSGTTNTGLYSPTVGQMAITAGGYEVMNFISAASSVNHLQSQASATANPTVIAALGSDSNIDITLTPKGTGSINIAKVNIDGGTIDGTVIGGSSAAAISGTTGNFSSTLLGTVGNFSSTVSATQITSTIITGTAPLVVSSTTPVANLSVASSAVLTTPRAIYGNNFDGSAALTQIIASTFGGTGNGFTKISGPTTSEKTITIPDANLTITAAAATVLDDTTVAAMVDTLGGASSTGTGGLVRTTNAALVTPNIGTPSAGVATNLSGTASGLTSGHVSVISDWTTFTPTGSWSTNTTYVGFQRRVGDSLDIRVEVQLAGAPTSAVLTVNLPAGLSIDTAKLCSTTASQPLGTVSLLDVSSQNYINSKAQYSSATAISCMYNSGSDAQAITQAAPFTFASGDKVYLLCYGIPISGWSS